MAAASTVIFYYDVVCPFAYTASKRIDAVVQRLGGTVHWRPVLLGGLYKLTEAPQGKDGSAMDVMAPAKKERVAEDLQRQMYRLGITGFNPAKHPQRTLHAMRILSGIRDQDTRKEISKAFFKAYWQDGYNLEETNNLQRVLDQTALRHQDANKMATDPNNSQQLKLNTEEAAGRGAFGVPSFYVGGKLFWGVDRMFMVERCLGKQDATPDRLMTPPTTGGRAVLTCYFDYSSPWSYLGYEQLEKTVQSVSPVAVTVEWVPLLLGALFRTIGTPNLPMAAMPVAKQQYYSSEMTYWAEGVAGVSLRWPDNFPLRTVLPLRVTLASGCDPRLVGVLYRAAWRDNVDIGDTQLLKQLLDSNGFDGSRLLEEANTQPIKRMLFRNNERAVNAGVCGVPSFQVNHGQTVWGQDRLNVVADLMCGWDYPPGQSPANSKL